MNAPPANVAGIPALAAPIDPLVVAAENARLRQQLDELQRDADLQQAIMEAVNADRALRQAAPLAPPPPRITNPPVGQATEKEKSDRATAAFLSAETVELYVEVFLGVNNRALFAPVTLAHGFKSYLFALGYNTLFVTTPNPDSLPAATAFDDFVRHMRNQGIPNNARTLVEQVLAFSHMSPRASDNVPTLIQRMSTAYGNLDARFRVDLIDPVAFPNIEAYRAEAQRRVGCLHAALLLNATGDKAFAVDVLSQIPDLSFNSVRDMMIQRASNYRSASRANHHVFAAASRDSATALAASARPVCRCAWRAGDCNRCKTKSCACSWRKSPRCRTCATAKAGGAASSFVAIVDGESPTPPSSSSPPKETSAADEIRELSALLAKGKSSESSFNRFSSCRVI